MFFSSARDLESAMIATAASDADDLEAVKEPGADESVDDLPSLLDAPAEAEDLRWDLSSCSRRSSSRSFWTYEAKKSLSKLSNRRSYIMIAYYGCLWLVSLLNLAWCCLQAWNAHLGKK
ncbi:Transmembrane protein adipocyte-associated 1 protein [Raphanus sativus]|nr:Transmembrane protein adipocyte-associated 1 protein [Raphanus sativus]